MRKGDLELLELRLEPLQAARDRHESNINSLLRTIDELRQRVKDLERNEEIHKTEIAQGLASIRSLLQRANRAAREQGIIEDDELEPVDNPAPVVNAPSTPDQLHADLRAKMSGRTLL